MNKMTESDVLTSQETSKIRRLKGLSKFGHKPLMYAGKAMTRKTTYTLSNIALLVLSLISRPY
jgi:hypothetical protein